jgi:hypothetical protein
MANEGKHTPGPWRERRESTRETARNHWQVIAASPHLEGKTQVVCELNGPWKEENYEANANLIAAAPALLAALRQLEWKAGNHIAALEAVGREANGLKTACEAARAAIAQSEGKS